MGKKIVLVAGIAAACLVAACGGGGGSNGEDVNDLGGIWQGALTLTKNECNLTLPSTINFTHQVGQNDTAIAVTDQDGVSYLGRTIGEDGFSVDAQLANSAGPTPTTSCNNSLRLVYNQIFQNSDDDAKIDQTLTQTCTTNTTCEVVYSGSGVRTSRGTTPPVVTPVATPGVTPTPNPNVRQDCEFVQERTYAGDGDCGLTSLGVEVTGTGAGATITLEPLGVNGAASFTQDAGNPLGAHSVSSDLTIKGVAGYGCTLECSAPLEFDVVCVKEGATSCKETF